MTKEQQKAVEDAGVDTANAWLRAVARIGNSSLEFNLEVLQVAAVHVITTCAFNQELQTGQSSESRIDMMCEGIKDGVQRMRREHQKGNLERLSSFDA